MEGRGVANSSWRTGERRFFRKIGAGYEARETASQFCEMETSGRGRRGAEAVVMESGKVSSFGGLTLRIESTEEEQKWRPDEQLRRFAVADGEEWKRKGGGAEKVAVERIILNDDEEDGVNGGRMKPLASFDVNRGMPPAQNRKLRIKLSPPDSNPAPLTMNEAANKGIRRSQEKENGGLVALFPGTTQIRGWKRKTISISDAKPQGGKRNRLPLEPGKEPQQPSKEPSESSAQSPPESDPDASNGMDMLLMALKAADPGGLRSISPSLPPPKARVIQAIHTEKTGKNSNSSPTVVGSTTEHRFLPPQEKIKEKAVSRKEGDVELRRRDRDGQFDEPLQSFRPRPHTAEGSMAGEIINQEVWLKAIARCEAKWAVLDLENSVEELETSKEEDDSVCTEDGQRAPSKAASTTGQHDTRIDVEELPACRDDEVDGYAPAKLHRYRLLPPTKPLIGERAQHQPKTKKEADRGFSGVLLQKGARGAFHSQSASSKNKEEGILDAREVAVAALRCNDADADLDVFEYPSKPHRNTAALLQEDFGNCTNLLEGRRKENVEEQRPRFLEKSEAVIKPLSRLHPSQTRILVSQEQTFNQQASKEYQQQQQQPLRKLTEREPTRQNSGVTLISLRGEGHAAAAAAKSQDGIREGCARDTQYFPKPSKWTKYQFGAGQQLTRKEVSVAADASDQRPWDYTRKRKTSDHVPAWCIVPKQVKLASASSLIETGDPAQPSVGSVVVECLPSSTERLKDDNGLAPFYELQNRVASWSQSSLPQSNLKSTKDTGKENRTLNGFNATAPNHYPSSTGARAPSKQICGNGIHRAAGSGTLPGTLSVSGNSLHSIQNHLCAECKPCKLHVGSGLHSAHGTHLHAHAHAHRHPHPHPQQVQRVQQVQQVQQCSSVALAAGSITRTTVDNDDSESHHEIAGITMQRRSWEALKAAEYFAKRRFDPEPAAEAAYENPHRRSVPSIPSRFQGSECHHQAVPPSKLKTTFAATHSFSHSSTGAFSGSLGATSHAAIPDKKVAGRRGPYKLGNKPERLSTKVLSRNLENYVLKDGAQSFQNGAHGFSGNGCYATILPRSSKSGLPKVPTLKPRQRRGHKKLEKEKVRTITVKASSAVCNFKPLSEPSGLLGACKPGIIQRVRNSVQIRAILGAFIGAAASGKSGLLKLRHDSNPPSLTLAITAGAEGELKEKSGVSQAIPKEGY